MLTATDYSTANQKTGFTWNHEKQFRKRLDKKSFYVGWSDFLLDKNRTLAMSYQIVSGPQFQKFTF